MLIKRGDSLSDYCKVKVEDNWHQRDFVSSVRLYLEMDYDKVLAISGLRGTGKTVGILQSIDGLDALYVCAQEGEDCTGNDYVELLKCANEKYIVIDEYTWIKDRKLLDPYLYTLVQNGKRVIITGTESFTLEFLNYGTLIHRVEYLHTTKFSFPEYCRLTEQEMTGFSCIKYLKEGGVFEDYVINNFNTMQNYVKTAYIDNLVRYFNGAMEEQHIRDIIYTIFYCAVCDSTKSKSINIKDDAIRLQAFQRFGIQSAVDIDSFEFHRITNLLEIIGAIHVVANYQTVNSDKPEFRTYITNPALSTQMFKAIYDKVPERFVLGFTFEAMCVSHMYNRLYDKDELYYFESRDGNNYEIYFIIYNRKAKCVYFFDCKYNTSAVLKGNMSLLRDELDNMFPDAEDYFRYLVYNGESQYRSWVKENGIIDVLCVPLGDMLEHYYFYEDNKNKIIKGRYF